MWDKNVSPHFERRVKWENYNTYNNKMAANQRAVMYFLWTKLLSKTILQN